MTQPQTSIPAPAPTRTGYSGRSVKRSVTRSMLFMGLLAETVSLILIVRENKSRFTGAFDIATIVVLIATLLLHNYFTHSSYEKVDRLQRDDLERLGFSAKWIEESWLENVMRTIIFILFAILSGEITYIIVVTIRVWSVAESINTHMFTIFYVTTYFVLSCMMVLWHFGGLCIDRKVYTHPKRVDDQRVLSFPRPFGNALITFAISDVLACLMWICFFLIFVCNKWGTVRIAFFFAAIYIIVIWIRAIQKAWIRKKAGTLFSKKAARVLFIVMIMTSISCLIVVLYFSNASKANTTIWQDIKGRDTDTIKKIRPLNIIMEEDSKPMYYMRLDSAGNYVAAGYGYEFAKKLCSYLHCNYTIMTARFSDLQDRVRDGEADIIIAGMTDEDVDGLDSTKAYLNDVYRCIICRKRQASLYTDAFSLRGKTIGIFKGTSGTLKWVQEYCPDASIDASHTESGWLDKFNESNWDAVVYEYIYGKEEIKMLYGAMKDSLAIAVKELQGTNKQFKIFFAFQKDNRLKDSLDNAIDIMMHSGFYRRLHAKYLEGPIIDTMNVQ